MNSEPLHPREIRGVIIPISGGRLLLPNATLAEIITLTSPEPVPDAPAWLRGRIPWRGWQLPLVAFSTMAGLSEPSGRLNSRVTVLKAFGGNPRMPYIAVVTQGFPRLTTVADDALTPLVDGGAKSRALGVYRYVRLRDEDVIIPDLIGIEQALTQVLENAPEPA